MSALSVEVPVPLIVTSPSAEIWAPSDAQPTEHTAGGASTVLIVEDDPMVREMLELCARTCEACAAECEKHEHEHCRLCAQMCRECAADCRNAAEAVLEVA